jgi:hypothetical protein
LGSVFRWAEQIRVVDVSAVAGYEHDDWTLPELVVLGADVMYDVQYDAHGVLTGAHRYDGRDLIALWRAFIGCLYDGGEEFAGYYRREIESRAPSRSSRG